MLLQDLGQRQRRNGRSGEGDTLQSVFAAPPKRHVQQQQQICLPACLNACTHALHCFVSFPVAAAAAVLLFVIPGVISCLKQPNSKQRQNGDRREGGMEGLRHLQKKLGERVVFFEVVVLEARYERI